jgi:glutamine---fructose-6-phosphate transaminase (isomerizing)
MALQGALKLKEISYIHAEAYPAGGRFVFADPDAGIENGPGVTMLEMPAHIEDFQAPIAFTVPLQLLAYHVAVLKGTDVDQPRNLAESVTVE